MVNNITSQVLTSIEPIINSLEYIEINHPVIPILGQQILSSELSEWDNEYVFSDNTPKSVNYLALFSALSFCYWTQSGYWQRYVEGVELYGSYSLMYILKNAIESGLDITDASIMSSITFDEFSKLLESHNGIEIPFIHERYLIMKEIGSVLNQKYGGLFTNLFELANYDANKINDLLVRDFSCFQDSHIVDGSEVRFYKKSQEVIMLTYEQFKGQGFGKIAHVEDLTVSSDYKLPQVMNAFNLFSYKSGLKQKIINKSELEEDSREAIEIRATSIYIGNLLREYLTNTLDVKIKAIEINNKIWTMSQKSDFDGLPHPRIKSIWV